MRNDVHSLSLVLFRLLPKLISSKVFTTKRVTYGSRQEAKVLSKEKPKVIKQWLSRQAFWQVHLPPPKRVDRPHYEVKIPNEVHQFDL